MPGSRIEFVPLVAVVCAGVLVVACVREDPAARSGETTAAAPRAPSLWRDVDGSPQIVLGGDFDDRALRDAIQRAQETAPDARARWHADTVDDRANWAIKWSAPTLDGAVEHIWVRPLTWTRFRIEGRLANPPRRELACGRGMNDIVGFPIEELVDWVRHPEDGPGDEPEGAVDDERNGGFTVRVLEERFGPARNDG